MQDLIISGGSGLLGTALAARLKQKGYKVVLLSRQKKKESPAGIPMIYWDPEKNFIDTAFRSTSCIIINLAGAGVAEKRWTPARKRLILESRTQSLQTLYKAAASGQLRITKLVSASATGYYGEAAGWCREDDPPGDSFLAQVCRAWESEALHFVELNIPVAITRIGIVLSNDGGAWPQLTRTWPLGIAALPGGGQQVMSWIHIDDVCGILEHLAMNAAKGIFNTVAPEPATMKALVRSGLQVSGSRALMLPVPAPMIRLLLGEMAGEILQGVCVSADAIQEASYEFRYPGVHDAMKQLYTV